MIQKLLNTSQAEDVLFLSGIIISIMNEKEDGDSSRSILPELFSTLGTEGTLNLIKYFGGETIEIPKHEDLYKSLLALVCYYKRKIEGKSWEDVKEDLKVDINPHALGKVIKLIDQRISVEVQELQDLGIEDFIKYLKKDPSDGREEPNNADSGLTTESSQ